MFVMGLTMKGDMAQRAGHKGQRRKNPRLINRHQADADAIPDNRSNGDSGYHQIRSSTIIQQ